MGAYELAMWLSQFGSVGPRAQEIVVRAIGGLDKPSGLTRLSRIDGAAIDVALRMLEDAFNDVDALDAAVIEQAIEQVIAWDVD